MSWEKFEHDFPNGAQTEEFGFVTAGLLRNTPKIGVIPVVCRAPARHMTIQEWYYVYGKDNEFAIIDKYNVNKTIPQAGTIDPLSVYGAAMLHDYLEYNYIPSGG